MTQMQLQRQRGNQQKSQRRQQRQPVGGLDGLDPEDAHQRRQNECACHQSRDERVQDDQHAPLEPDFVRIHEAFNTVHNPSQTLQPAFDAQA